MTSVDSSAALGYEPANGGGERRVWVPAGGTRRVGDLSDAQRRRLLSAVLEVKSQPETRLILLGVDVESLRPAGRASLRERVAFLPADGGLLSNLNAWENIVLPIGFHRPGRLHGAQGEIERTLADLDVDPASLLAKLPERMTPYEKILIGYVRITLDKPDLLLAEEPKGEMDPAERAAAAKFPGIYLDRCPGGTYVQLESASGP